MPDPVLECLLFVVFLKGLELLLTLFTILSLGASRHLKEFWNKYWDWKYLNENTLRFSLWLVAVLSYAYCYHLLGSLEPVSLNKAWDQNPLLTIYVIGALMWFVGSAVLQMLGSVRHTIELCRELKRQIFLERLSKIAMTASLFYFRTSGWPWIVGTLVGKMLPDIIIGWTVEKRIRRAIERFLLLAIIEYTFRASVVIAAYYLVTGDLRVF